MKKKSQINIIGSIGEDLVEGIRDITHILEGMREEINTLKEKVRQISSKNNEV
jgi:methyl-accepting chemotaxis protein